ncbi:MAG: LysE/ArgO family amino acid transporter [Acidimicrobiales bacterium]|jgi:L-lysine exporter family protein LysE/ArgO
MGALLAGLLTGLSLIVAIGAQNAYVLRMGLSRHHINLIVAICAVSDIVLITLGIAGIGGVIRSEPSALQILRWIGVVYLSLFALRSFWRALRPEVLLPSEAKKPTRRAVVSTTLAFTFLNPHVYLDTVLLLGSIGNQYGHDRWLFALGASVSSLAWFSGLGYGARFASRLMSRPVTWRALDVAIGVVMVLIALKLTLTPLPS